MHRQNRDADTGPSTSRSTRERQARSTKGKEVERHRRHSNSRSRSKSRSRRDPDYGRTDAEALMKDMDMDVGIEGPARPPISSENARIRGEGRHRSHHDRRRGKDRDEGSSSRQRAEMQRGQRSERQREKSRRQTRSRSRSVEHIEKLEALGATRQDGDGKGKGKGRAVEVIDVDMFDAPIHDSSLAVQDRVASSSDTPQGDNLDLPSQDDPQSSVMKEKTKKTLRPARNRGILDAVQAHLGTGVRAGVQRKGASSKTGDYKDVPGAEDINKKASSLERSPQDPDSSQNVTLSSVEPSPSGQAPNLSASDVMARTRARLAKLKNEPVAGVSPSAASPTPIMEQQPTPSTIHDIRARLLSRLDQEKRLGAQAVEQNPTGTNEVLDNESGSNAGLDPQALAAESKLRKQAQVRVRLAAAKRNGSTLKSNTDDTGASSAREESLKDKLRERRINA